MNEEGLPIIEISEPIEDSTVPRPPWDEATIEEQEPTPFAELSRQERLRLRGQRDRILDLLEAEEEREARREADLERQVEEQEAARRVKEAQMDISRRLAAREMQKKMGKALLKNIVEAREREEKALSETESAMNSPIAGPSNGKTVKPRKSVSFAEPASDEDGPSSKPLKKRASLAWGDVSVGSLRGGMPRVKLKADLQGTQPMRMKVVERAPGEPSRLDTVDGDSDDESASGSEGGEEGDFSSDFRNNDNPFGDERATLTDEDGEDEDEFDLSQAQLQREVALEYVRLRGSIGAEAAQAMTSHSHDGEDEWDQPVSGTILRILYKPDRRRCKGGSIRSNAISKAS